MYFHDLPDDIYSYLVFYLQLEDIVSLSKSCKRLESYVTNQTRYFNFENQYSINEEEALRVLKPNRKQALKLSLNGCFWLRRVRDTAVQCSNLRQLSLLRLQVSPLTIGNILTRLNHLQSLSIQLHHSFPLSCFTSPFLETFRNLRHYTVHVSSKRKSSESSTCFSDHSIDPLLRFCHSLQSLKVTLDPKCSISPDPPPTLLHLSSLFLVNCPSLFKYFFPSVNVSKMFENGLKSLSLTFPTPPAFNSHLTLCQHVVTLRLKVQCFCFDTMAPLLPNLQNLTLLSCSRLSSSFNECTNIFFPKLKYLCIKPSSHSNYDLPEVCRRLTCPMLQALFLEHHLHFLHQQDLMRFLHSLPTGLDVLYLPSMHLDTTEPPHHTTSKRFKAQRVSHVHVKQQESHRHAHILAHITTHNPFLSHLHLPSLTLTHGSLLSEDTLSPLTRLKRLSRLSFPHNALISGDFLRGMHLSHLCIAVTPSFMHPFFTHTLPLLPNLTYLKLSSHHLELPHTTTLKQASLLLTFVLQFHTSNLHSLHLSPQHMLQQHPTLSFLVLLSPLLDEKDTVVLKQRAARLVQLKPQNLHELHPLHDVIEPP